MMSPEFPEFPQGIFPVDRNLLDNNYPYLVWQVRFLRDADNMMRTHPDPTVRAKFLTTWDFYRRRYPRILAVLEEGGFDMKVFHPSFDWSKQLQVLAEDIQHFKSAWERSNKRLLVPGKARSEGIGTKVI